MPAVGAGPPVSRPPASGPASRQREALKPDIIDGMGFLSASSPQPRLLAALPEPNASWTVPIIIVFALIFAFAILRKVVGLALIAVIVAGVFIAYQGGAFDQWVNSAKNSIHQQEQKLPKVPKLPSVPGK